jgi:coenzyme F420-0:L-glutamate ligase / coenzyme F420-1:gamma-L-glutamate ligase
MPPVLEVFAVEGLPEVEPGTDLPALIAAGLADTVAADPRLAALRPDDVVVVTSKVVSKAEGAFVDLRTVEPRPEAIAFGEHWGRDPRQIEVVLREARRVVRMANGVIITETRHGFVCANGGVDASNVGPESGDVVLLLPEDPDASAAAIRSAIRTRTGVDVPVIVSDTFGRPWRWGVADVAIGLSGLAPLDDLRDSKDVDGRVMRTTIRAVADEIASAAELALGKVGRRPVAIVRGASPHRAEATIADALIPTESDLFP